jgi:hypothetical protein
MKVCNTGIGSKLFIVFFLVLLIVLCSIGLSETGKYSCDNGLWMSNDDVDSNTCTSAFEKCKNDPSHNRCMKEHNCGKCIDGHLSEIILIIIITLSSIYLLFKLYCMFHKKGPMTMM